MSQATDSTELSAFDKQMLEDYEVERFHDVNGKKYCEFCDFVHSKMSRLAQLDANRGAPTDPPDRLKAKLIGIVQIFLEDNEDFLQHANGVVSDNSKGRKRVTNDEYKNLCRAYAVKIVEEAWNK